MDTYEQRLAALETEWRAKYNAEELKDAAAKGHAMADESYPVKDEDDLTKAIKAVGRGNADHDSIRKHIMARAKALKLSKLIPDNWNADGSLEAEAKAAEWDAEHRSGPSHADTKHAIEAAIRDLPDAGKLSAYLLDFDDDTATYESGGKTFQVPYTVQGDGSVKLGDPQEVQIHHTYKPVESKSATRRKERRRAVPLMPEVCHWQPRGLRSAPPRPRTRSSSPVPRSSTTPHTR